MQLLDAQTSSVIEPGGKERFVGWPPGGSGPQLRPLHQSRAVDSSPAHTAVLPSTPSALSLHPALPSDNPQRGGCTLDRLSFLFTVLVVPLFLSLGDLKPQHLMLNVHWDEHTSEHILLQITFDF